jgi:hypothetical protein
LATTPTETSPPSGRGGCTGSRARSRKGKIVDGIKLAYCQPYVEAYFIFNLQLWDDADLGLWQSAVFWVDRTPKPSFPFVQQVISQVNAHQIDCSNLKGGPVPTAFHPLHGVDVATVTFARRDHSLRARVRTAEDATYVVTLERATGQPVARHAGQIRLGWARTLSFSVAQRPGTSYRLVLRLSATANPARRSTLVSRVFRVG